MAWDDDYCDVILLLLLRRAGTASAGQHGDLFREQVLAQGPRGAGGEDVTANQSEETDIIIIHG